MKRNFLVVPLAFAALMLSGCPDAKLPTPAPTVPKPKAQHTADHVQPAIHARDWLSAAMAAKADPS